MVAVKVSYEQRGSDERCRQYGDPVRLASRRSLTAGHWSSSVDWQHPSHSRMSMVTEWRPLCPSRLPGSISTSSVLGKRQRFGEPKTRAGYRAADVSRDTPPVALTWPTWRPSRGGGRTPRDEKWPR